MVDWTNPVNSQLWDDYTQAIKDRDISLAKMDFTSDSNIPTGTIRWNGGAGRFETWNGSSWAALIAKYLIDVDTVDGLHAADLAPIAHVGAGGAAHAVVTSGANGFMSAADKVIFDAATNLATASTLVKRDASGRFRAAAPSAADDVARKAETDAVQTNLTAHIGTGASAHALATPSAHGFMSSSDKAKLNGIEAGATADQSAAEILTLLKTVDGAGSGLDADLLDGFSSASFMRLAAQSLSGNGYMRLAGASGLMIQWMLQNVTSGSNIESWPTAFPTACLQAIAGNASYDSSKDRGQVGVTTFSTTTVTLNVTNNVSSARIWGIGY